ncbi:transcription factor SOX-1-like [Amphibalanus amphitrite]|uniref:transcription factor SOX-1-like n=1 Tax=Amphibalanus amphitrite TaxID=1232801 RepID=UPI001C926CAD|nr:transcription factor SOX-1-like [Amphibalanus amphitrite]
MNFTGFGFNYDAPLVPGALSPSMPFYALHDGCVVPTLSGDLTYDPGLDPYGVAQYVPPPARPAEGVADTGQQPAPPPPPPPPPQPRPSAAPKIRRPPNAFMVFANERRKLLARAFPNETNQSISVRLGSMWKAMPADRKTVYYQVAKEAAAEHKRLYPSYVYSPKEARMRKQARELVRKEKAAKPATDGTGAELAGMGCEGDPPSTETRAKLMEVAQLLDSLSSDRLLHQPRRRSPYAAEPGGALSADADSSTAAGGAPADRPVPQPGVKTETPPSVDPGGVHRSAYPPAGQGVSEGVARGPLHHPVSSAHGRETQWTVVPPGPSSGAGAFVPVGRGPDGQLVYQSLAAGYGPAPAADAAPCYLSGRAELADGGCHQLGVAGRPADHPWAAVHPAASAARPGPVHHHLHGAGLLRHPPDAPCQSQLVPLTSSGWPLRLRTPAGGGSAVAMGVPRGRLACAGSDPARPHEFCLHLLAGGSCSHCRPTGCCGTLSAACQCQCPAVLSSPQGHLQQRQQPSQLTPTALGPGGGPQPERPRRPTPIRLRIPDPRYRQGLRAAPAVDLRSCWRTVAEAQCSAAPPAAYLRPASPSIEELVSHHTPEPLGM